MTTDEIDHGAAQLSVMTMDAACQSDPTQTGQRIVDLAAKLFPCAAVDLVRRCAGGGFQVSASSDAAISDQLSSALREWPHDPYPGTDSRNGRPVAEHPAGYLERRGSTGVVDELTFRLRIDQADHGFLRFLLVDPGTPDAADIDLAAAFAAHAAIVLDRAALQETVGNLLTAIVSNREIGAAVGILMARCGIGYDAGFALLKATSQNNNRKLREVVGDVLYTGELPNDPCRSASPAAADAMQPIIPLRSADPARPGYGRRDHRYQ